MMITPSLTIVSEMMIWPGGWNSQILPVISVRSGSLVICLSQRRNRDRCFRLPCWLESPRSQLIKLLNHDATNISQIQITTIIVQDSSTLLAQIITHLLISFSLLCLLSRGLVVGISQFPGIIPGEITHSSLLARVASGVRPFDHALSNSAHACSGVSPKPETPSIRSSPYNAHHLVPSGNTRGRILV